MNKKRPSVTALLILRVIIFASFDRRYTPLVDPESTVINKRIAENIVPLFPLFMFLISNSITRALFYRLEQWLNPGFILHVVARKNFIFMSAQGAIQAGTNQIIILGAGYDSLGLRLTRMYPQITCFEIDHPNTGGAKRRALMPLNPPATLELIAADLSVCSLSDILTSHMTFDAQKNTLVILEGLLMYIAEPAVNQLFTEIHSLGTRVSCLYTFMTIKKKGTIGFRSAHPLTNHWLAYNQEPFLWGISPQNLPEKMHNLGFKTVKIWQGTELLQYSDNVSFAYPIAEGELLCMVTN